MLGLILSHSGPLFLFGLPLMLHCILYMGLFFRLHFVLLGLIVTLLELSFFKGYMRIEKGVN